MRPSHLALSLLLVACETTKIEPNPAPAASSAATATATATPTIMSSDGGDLGAELSFVEAPADIKESLTGSPIPGGVKLARAGRALCPLATNGATIRAAKTGPHMASVFVVMRQQPGFTECRATANITVRGLEPGKWRIFVLGMGGRLDTEVEVAP